MRPTNLLETNRPETNRKQPDTELADGATAVVEAATAEDAIARVHAEHGPQARIVDARRQRRGGLGGFFATEVVQLHVGPPEDPPGQPDAAPSPAGEDATPPPAAGTAAPPTGGAAAASGSPSPVDRLLQHADDAPDTIDFATFLRQQMAEEQLTDMAAGPGVAAGQVGVEGGAAAEREIADAGEVGTEGEIAAEGQATAEGQVGPEGRAVTEELAPVAGVPVADPLPAVTPPPRTPSPTSPEDLVAGPAWSTTALLHLGLPLDLVRSIDLDESDDDIAWTMALATALAPLCGAIPAGPALLVGPHADRVGAAVTTPTARSQMWFDALSEGRWIHLVVGGDGWRDHLASGPRVVSWSEPAALPEALRCAHELGLTLGYGELGGFVRRARPVDVALAVRAQVDAR